MQVRRYIRAKRHRKSAGPRRKSLAPGASMVNHINMNIGANNRNIIDGDVNASSSHSKLEKKLQGRHKLIKGRAAGHTGGDEGENSSRRNTGGGDPFYENWDEAELSSHNNVIIELVEIPHCVLQKSEKSSSGKIPGTPASTSINVHHEKNSSKSSETIPFADGGIASNNSVKIDEGNGENNAIVVCAHDVAEQDKIPSSKNNSGGDNNKSSR